MREFKTNVAEQLINPHLMSRERRRRENQSRSPRNSASGEATSNGRGNAARLPPSDVVGSIDDPHYLAQMNSSGATCFLCAKLGAMELTPKDECIKKVQHGCSKCELAFHPNCFTAFHMRGALGRAGNEQLAARLTRLDTNRDINGKEMKFRRKKVTGIPTLSNLHIPQTPKDPNRKRKEQNQPSNSP